MAMESNERQLMKKLNKARRKNVRSAKKAIVKARREQDKLFQSKECKTSNNSCYKCPHQSRCDDLMDTILYLHHYLQEDEK